MNNSFELRIWILELTRLASTRRKAEILKRSLTCVRDENPRPETGSRSDGLGPSTGVMNG
jgi:hypothetical protein